MLGFTWKNKQGKFNWDVAKPSNVPVERRPAWMTYDDAWVEEVKRGLRACKVFLFLPLFFVSASARLPYQKSILTTVTVGLQPDDWKFNISGRYPATSWCAQ